ncbi:MAG: hypothetical protein LBE35_00385 [Clostridiales bacterium]|jgi:alpha-tubulin suppressor-like RCC1 family protein|nr:hypothetical protein [Clostridiales bacterium]
MKKFIFATAALFVLCFGLAVPVFGIDAAPPPGVPDTGQNFTLTLSSSPYEGGLMRWRTPDDTDFGRNITEFFGENTRIHLMAVPVQGWEFVGWYEGNARIDSERAFTFNIISDRNLEARFVQTGQQPATPPTPPPATPPPTPAPTPPPTTPPPTTPPTPPPTTTATGRVVAAAQSWNRMALLDNGDLFSWGRNDFGHVGDGTTQPRHEPVKIMENIVAIAAGGNHSLALTRDGYVYGWGANTSGQVGDFSGHSVNSPARIMGNVRAIAAGSTSSFAITTDNVLWGWGASALGELSDLARQQLQASDRVRIMDNVAQVSILSNTVKAVRTDGTLWGWGSIMGAQIYMNTIRAAGVEVRQLSRWRDTPLLFISTPVQIFENVAYVSTGTLHTMAITTDGVLWGWGANHHGQIGDGTVISRAAPGQRFHPVRIMDNVVSVSTPADIATTAITADGSLWVWGFSGIFDFIEGRESIPTPMRVTEDIASIPAESLAITTRGDLLTWTPILHSGTSWFTGERQDPTQPVRIEFPIQAGQPLHATATAAPSAHNVRINGQPVALAAFNIGDSNFFMLRDIAFALNGTAGQFEVAWDGARNAINLVKGQAYTPVGGEMTAEGGQAATATPTTASVLVNGQPVNLRAYNIGGNNFFMLRDLGEALGFGVDWDAATATILINTN